MSRDIPIQNLKNQRAHDQGGFEIIEGASDRFGNLFSFAVHMREQDNKTKHRCEISHTATAGKGLPRERTVWHAFAMKANKWVDSQDEQILAQWMAYTSNEQNPFVALTLAKNELSLKIRHNDVPGAPKKSNLTKVVWSSPNFDINNWHTFAIRANISWDPTKNPFVELYVNGQLAARHDGPIGYNTDAPMVAKFGYYRYVQTRHGGPWPLAQPVRQILYSKSVVISEWEHPYTTDSVLRQLERH